MSSKPLKDTEVKMRHEADEAAPAMLAEEHIEAEVKSKPKSWVQLAIRYLLPLALTVALVWYMFRQVDFGRMMEILREGVDFWWILLAMGISVFSHIFRAARWRLQLNALGIHVPFMALCCSIFGCYALNLVFPRLGEVWRCTYVSKEGKAHFTTVLGSMVSDRLTDTLSVLLLVLLTFIVANSALVDFLAKYPVGKGIIDLLANPWVWVAGSVTLILIFCVFYFGRNTGLVKQLVGWIRELWSGFATLWQMKGRLQFVMWTVLIWGAYYFQLYVAFFAFGFTRELCAEPSLAYGLTPCLVAFVLSSIGMAIPSNGGLGPWNIAVMFGLAVYGITETEGTAFSMLQWSGQTVMLIILGIYTMAYISLSGKKLKTKKQ